MIDVIDTNAAIRLHELLVAIEKNAEPKTERLDRVLAQIYEIPREDYQFLLKMYGDIRVLIENAVSDAKHIQDERHAELYLRPLQTVTEKLKNAHLYSQAQTHMFDAETMSQLEYAGNMLTLHPTPSQETLVSTDQLAELKRQCDDLLDRVLSLDIPDTVRACLINALEKFRYAIVTYRLVGNEGIERALEESVGPLYRAKSWVEDEEPENSNSRNFMAQLFEVIRSLNAFISLGEKAHKALPYLGDMLNQLNNML